jgi:hypothetical protein
MRETMVVYFHFEWIKRRGAAQISLDEFHDDPPRTLQAQGRFDPDALPPQGLVPPLDLSIALTKVW